MELPVVGRVENPEEELDLEPLEVPVCAYTADHEEVRRVFKFRAMQPTGASIDVLKGMNDAGDVPVQLILGFIDACLVGDSLSEWKSFLADPDLYIQQDALIDLYKVVMEVYAARPTKRRSGSASSPQTSKKTSPANSRKKVAASKSGKKSRSS